MEYFTDTIFGKYGKQRLYKTRGEGGINPKTVAKWKKREFTADRRTGPTGSQVDRLVG
jgi:hypothetical protein